MKESVPGQLAGWSLPPLVEASGLSLLTSAHLQQSENLPLQTAVKGLRDRGKGQSGGDRRKL